MRTVSSTALYRTLMASFVGLLCIASLVHAEELVVEEVVTTAQRRAENVQEVPISVGTLSGEELDNLFDGGEDIRALATRIPSLYAESSNGRLAPRFYIRGLGNTDFDLAASQPVSIIVDDVVQENVILKSFPLFDIERVEVLRGPQGTLFGRNTPAGIVKFDTGKPTSEPEGYLSTSYAPGAEATASVQGAMSGPLSDAVNGRFSFLVQDRSDWIDNNVPAASDFNGLRGHDVLGGFNEIAFRGQLHFIPSDSWNVLGNFHGRIYDGTASIFRANVVGPGSQGFNSNYDRDVVTYDEGDNNPQEAEAFGSSIKMEFNVDDRTTITSITGKENVKNKSLGDIDGGYGADFLPDAGPCPPFDVGGCIPFNSVTQDGLNDLDQFTQEIRIARQVDDQFFWQGGVYLFKSSFVVETNPFFVPPSQVKHRNHAWAVFGHFSRDVTDAFTLTGGMRYTNDRKKATVLQAPVPSDPVSVSDDQFSWDISGLYQLNADVNIYGRIATGYRAPTIQARDVAFFGVPSVAKSENITSYEAGFKSILAGGRVRMNGTAFYYEIKNQQLSAIGGGGNFVQLVNADKGRGIGVDVDTELLVNENLTLTLGASTVETKLKDNTLVVPPCGSGFCTVVDPLDANGNAIIGGNSFANAPDYILTVTANYTTPYGPDGEMFFFTDWAFQGRTEFLLYEAREFYSKNTFEGGIKFGYRNHRNNWELAVFGRNITDEENVKGVIDFNNLTAFDNEPRIVGVSFRKNWRQ